MIWTVKAGERTTHCRTLRAAYLTSLRERGAVYQGDKAVAVTRARTADGGMTLTARWAR